jgi:hypothetical protein
MGKPRCKSAAEKGKECAMAKLSFNLSQPAQPEPIFPRWFRAALFIFIAGTCGALITAALARG